MIPLQRVFGGERVVEQPVGVTDKVAVFGVVPPEGQLAGSVDRFSGLARDIQFPEAFFDSLGQVVKRRRTLGGPIGTNDGFGVELAKEYFRDAQRGPRVGYKLSKGGGIEIAGDQRVDGTNLVVEIVFIRKFRG